MRICPACAVQVAVTLRYCPQCGTLLPEPGYRSAPGYYAEPGYYADPRDYAGPGHYGEPEYDAEPGYPQAPGYASEPGFPAVPGYPAEPGYSGSYLPAPYVDALDQPRQYVTSSFQPGHYEADQHEAGPYEADQYEAEPYEAGQYEAEPYQTGRYEAPLYQPGEPDRGGLDSYGEAPEQGDPDGCDPFGDRFAGGGPETAASPARPAPAAVAGGDWDDTASRLLYPPPGPPRRAGRAAAGRRAQVISATLAAAALLAGLVTAWAAFGGHRGAGPGARLAGRQTAATRQASPRAARPAAPSPSSTAAPSPSVPAPGGGPAVVTMAPGLSQAPDAAQVDGFLASYFTAINTRDYQQYARLLVPARRAQLSAAAFARGYGTTTDTGASMVGISRTGRGVAATVTFTSEQRVAPGADVTGCTYWDITLYLQRQGGALLIGNPPAGYRADHRACL